MVYEGRVVAEEDGSQQLDQRAAVFRTVASFWQVGEHEWQSNAVTSRATYEEEWQEPQWQGSGWMVRTQHET